MNDAKSVCRQRGFAEMPSWGNGKCFGFDFLLTTSTRYEVLDHDGAAQKAGLIFPQGWIVL
jgi:hypothetical protein